MSEGPGFDVVSKRLESVRPGSAARMVVITGSLASTLLDSRAPMVLSKPFGSRQLLQAIDEVTTAANVRRGTI